MARGRQYDPRFVEYLIGLDDQVDETPIEIDDVPRCVRDAFEEDQLDRREWNGDLSE